MARLIYICSPLRATSEKSQERHIREAQGFAEVVEMIGEDMVAVVPHVWLTRFLDDDDPAQRALGIAMGEAALRKCDELWYLGPRISEDMQAEIDLAHELKISVFEWKHEYTPVEAQSSAVAGRWTSAPISASGEAPRG